MTSEGVRSRSSTDSRGHKLDLRVGVGSESRTSCCGKHRHAGNGVRESLIHIKVKVVS